MAPVASLMDATTVGLATLLLAAWWFKPSRPSNLSFRLHRLRRQSVAGPVRLPKETAVYRSGSHDIPLVRGIPVSSVCGEDGGGLWAVVTRALRSTLAESAKVGEVGGEQLTFAQAYSRILCIGSGLHHLLDNRPASILDLCTHPSLLSDLVRIACLGFGIQLLESASGDPISNLNLGPDAPGAILVSVHDIAKLASVQFDDSIPVIVVGDIAQADKAAKKQIARLIAMADIENDGVDRPVDPSPLAMEAPWINEFTPADFLAVLGGLVSPPARASGSEKQDVARDGAVVIERDRTSISSFVFVLHHLTSPPPPSALYLLTSQSHLNQPSLLLGLRPHMLVLCTRAATHRFTAMLNGFAHTWLTHTASFVARHLAQQHLSATESHGVALEWADLLPHQQWALGEYRTSVLGGHLAQVTLLASPTNLFPEGEAPDWTWARLGGVRVTQTWGPRALLGCVTMTAPLSVPGGGIAGGVLAHAAVKLVANTEEDADRRVGKVWVSTATGMGQDKEGKRVSGGWARTEVVAKVDEAGALWILQDECA